MWTIGEFWKTYFGILAENFGEMLEILRTFLRYSEINSEIILRNCLEYFHEIFWKLQKNVGKVNSRLILEKLMRNIEVNLNY